DDVQDVPGLLVEHVQDLFLPARVIPLLPGRCLRKTVDKRVGDADEQQGLGDERCAAQDGVSKRWQVETLQERMIARAVSDRRYPKFLALVHIERRDAGVRRLDDGQTLDLRKAVQVRLGASFASPASRNGPA